MSTKPNFNCPVVNVRVTLTRQALTFSMAAVFAQHDYGRITLRGFALSMPYIYALTPP
ncbi:hypothetical protein SB861_52925 [Paraburkholderia sp. SIMBA_049]